MTPETQSHQETEIDTTGNSNRLAAALRRINFLSRVVPATAGSRKTLNVMLLAVVLPILLLGVALVSFVTPNTSAATSTTTVNSQQVDLALEGILEDHAQALAALATDPILVNAVFFDAKQGLENEHTSINQRLEQILQVESGFESLALVNANGEVAATAGILHQDFYLWQNTPAFRDSLNSEGRPSISPLKFGVLALDEDGSIDLSHSRIERLVFTAGLSDRTNESSNDGLIVGIMKSDALVDSVQRLLHQEPAGPAIPDSLVAISQESTVSNDTNSGIQLLSLTPAEISAVSPESAREPAIRDATANDAITTEGLGSGPAYTGFSPFEKTGTSWFSALPSLSAEQSSQLLVNNVSLILATGSILLALTAAWFIVRSPQSPQPAIATAGYLNPAADASATFTNIDAKKASQRLVVVHESVRREMAAYLHGHVQSKLVALSMSLGICQTMLTREPDQASLLLVQIQDELQKVQDEDLRRVSHELYPAIVKMGLVPAMRSLINRFNELLETDLIIDTDVFAMEAERDTELPEKQRLGVYRIAEEALNNALKHAHANHVEVTLICDENRNLVLSVTDDGCGFDPEEMADSEGLAMMSDYAKAIGGQTEIISSPEKGTTVSLSLHMETPQMDSLLPGIADEPQFFAI